MGVVVDMCEHTESVDSKVNFNSQDGSFNFMTNDEISYPAGNYLIQISANGGGAATVNRSLKLMIHDQTSLVAPQR